MQTSAFVIITRPEGEGARRLAALAAAQGWQTILSPALTIEPLPGPEITAQGLAAIVLTSSEAAAPLAARMRARDLPVFAVGRITAEAAAAHGFTRICTGDGGVASLSRQIAGAALQGDILYARGETISMDLAAALRREGLKVREDVVYRALPIAALNAAARDAIASHRPGAVTFLSARTVESFEAAAAGLDLAHLHGVFLSDTAAAAARCGYAAKHVAAAPGLEALAALLAPLYTELNRRA